ncbi:hypothetical protein DPMN_005067 [Dreissena polymorpha]|uniref:Uncharacterized protein n=1 Tax=Dreissena polymorpha TaxID=45954 RepID=A0A9D4RU31_DREPO|nr:hypothetical protein DPMN_005067 [Dreissena polymorpha]
MYYGLHQQNDYLLLGNVNTAYCRVSGVNVLSQRVVKEAIDMRALKPALNKDGSRYQLSHTWDSTLTSLTPTISGVNVSQH